MSEPICPKCSSPHSYHDGNLWICPECSHEFTEKDLITKTSDDDSSDSNVIKDANGTILADGDTVVLIKDLKVKGATKDLKNGTKVKNIRLQGGNDGHNIACKIDGFGAMNLKSEFVRKST